MTNYTLSVYYNIVKEAARREGLNPATINWCELLEAAKALKDNDTDQSIARAYVYPKEFTS